MRRAYTCLWGCPIRAYGGGAYVPVKLCQAFSPPNKVRTWIPHPCGIGLKYIGLAALVPRAGKRTGYTVSERK